MVGGESETAGGASWSWQIDSICIWHTDCTKYANRHTIGFAVLFFQRYCSLSRKSTEPWRVRARFCAYECVRAQVVHLPGVSISLSWPSEPRPCSTNHMKGSPSPRVGLSKATLMFVTGDGCI